MVDRVKFFFVLMGVCVFRIAETVETYQNWNSDVDDYGCQCADYSCGCCAHIEAPKIGLNDTACVNVTYLPKEYGISFTMNIDKLYIFNETVSVRNPPPICAGAPILKEYADICIHFYDLDATVTKLHGCVDIEGRLHKIVVARYKVGCFNIGKSSRNFKKWKAHNVELIEKLRILKMLSQNKFKVA